MSADDLVIARQFFGALATVANTGQRDGLYSWLTADVEWVTPMRELHGIDEVHEQLTWITQPENFDLEFQIRELTVHGAGRIATEVHELYRQKVTGDVAHTRDRQIELTIRDGRVARYEMRIVG